MISKFTLLIIINKIFQARNSLAYCPIEMKQLFARLTSCLAPSTAGPQRHTQPNCVQNHFFQDISFVPPNCLYILIDGFFVYIPGQYGVRYCIVVICLIITKNRVNRRRM